MAEEWRDVVGYEGLYEVSDLGRVRSLREVGHCRNNLRKIPKIKTQWIGKNGYPYVSLSRENVPANKTVHGMVLAAFRGPRPPGMEACHADGSRTNSRLDNLRWDTSTANEADKKLHGTFDLRGTILSDEDVRCIRAEPHFKGVNVMLGRAFGVARATIKDVRTGRSHVVRPVEGAMQ